MAFTAEMVSKISHKGLWDTSRSLEASNSDNKFSFLKDRWCQFDSSMLFFIIISVILQVHIFHLDLVKQPYCVSLKRAQEFNNHKPGVHFIKPKCRHFLLARKRHLNCFGIKNATFLAINISNMLPI